MKGIFCLTLFFTHFAQLYISNVCFLQPSINISTTCYNQIFPRVVLYIELFTVYNCTCSRSNHFERLTIMILFQELSASVYERLKQISLWVCFLLSLRRKFKNFSIFRVTINFDCVMDFRNYPFDEQLCPTQIQSCKFFFHSSGTFFIVDFIKNYIFKQKLKYKAWIEIWTWMPDIWHHACTVFYRNDPILLKSISWTLFPVHGQNDRRSFLLDNYVIQGASSGSNLA